MLCPFLSLRLISSFLSYYIFSPSSYLPFSSFLLYISQPHTPPFSLSSHCSVSISPSLFIHVAPSFLPFPFFSSSHSPTLNVRTVHTFHSPTFSTLSHHLSSHHLTSQHLTSHHHPSQLFRAPNLQFREVVGLYNLRGIISHAHRLMVSRSPYLSIFRLFFWGGGEGNYVIGCWSGGNWKERVVMERSIL